MNIDGLSRMVAEDAALRPGRCCNLSEGRETRSFRRPIWGEGRNSQPRHVYERRRVNEREAWCVLVDSVQAQANRLEESLLDAIVDGMSIRMWL